VLSPKLIQDIVAGQFGLTGAQLLGRSRLQPNALARQVAMLLCLEMIPHASLPRVGHWFGRHHTTVLHARDATRRKIAFDRKLAKQVERLRRTIRRVG
jgi:chromosomal replication initiator protein